MRTWEIGERNEVDLIEDSIDKKVYSFSRYCGDSNGYSTNEIDLCIDPKDKSIFFSSSNGEGFIFLYPEQAKQLKEILNQNL